MDRFTLTEPFVLIATIPILAALLFPTIARARAKARLAGRAGEMKIPGRRFPRPSRRLCLTVVALTGIALAGTAFYFNSRVTVPSFSWAKAQGWDVQPVRVVRLDPPWLMQFERVPGGLSQQDAALQRMCWVAQFGFQRYYDSQGSTVAARQVYEHVLALRPHFFYAEYEIADWYREHHKMALYHAWLQQSLRDAPAILAGRIVYDDDKPVQNAMAARNVSVYDKQGNVVGGPYRFVTTDAEGCYYLPVFKGIYSTDGTGLRFDSLWDAQGKNLNLYITGPEMSQIKDAGTPRARLTLGMVATSHVGVLPKLIARPKIQIISPSGSQTGDDKHPVLIKGNVLDLVWRPVPGAARYQVEITREDSMVEPDDPHFKNGAASTEVKLPLSGTDISDGKAPLFNRNTSYGLMIYAFSSTDPNKTQALLDASDEYDFRPVDAVAPLALTKANLAQAFGAGAAVISVQQNNTQVIVTGSAPRETLIKSSIHDDIIERLFGFQASEEHDGEVDSQGRQKFRMTFTK